MPLESVLTVNVPLKLAMAHHAVALTAAVLAVSALERPVGTDSVGQMFHVHPLLGVRLTRSARKERFVLLALAVVDLSV